MNLDITRKYNYDEFTEEKVMPWMNFDNSPILGEEAPDFPLWALDGTKTSLSDVWSKNKFTVVEFGSFA